MWAAVSGERQPDHQGEGVNRNLVQTRLLGPLREARERRKGETPARPAANAADTTPPPSSRHRWRRVVAGGRRLLEGMNNGLAAFYRTCGRTPPDRSPAITRILLLRANETVRITRASRATRLEVWHGTVWLTAAPARGDVLLHEGDCFVLDGGWPLVVQALGRAGIVLRASPRRE